MHTRDRLEPFATRDSLEPFACDRSRFDGGICAGGIRHGGIMHGGASDDAPSVRSDCTHGVLSSLLPERGTAKLSGMTETLTGSRDARSFHDLTVWQEATTLARWALDIADALPPGYAFLADQLRRASTSIPLNIAEGNGKPTRRDYLRVLAVARGSLNEVDAIVEILRGRPCVNESAIETLTRHVVHTGRLLTALMKALE
jgi:four helix bundle protein